MMADARLRKWLNHKPRPVVVACDDHIIDAPNTDRGWAEVAETIEQLRPDRIVCRDGTGKVLRAKPFEYFFPSEASEPQPVPVATSPEQQTLQNFAVLLANAHKSAAETHGPILQAAMEFTERLSVRLARTESECDRLRAQVADLETEIAELHAEAKAAAQAPNDLAGAFMQGQMMKAAQSADLSVVDGGKK